MQPKRCFKCIKCHEIKNCSTSWKSSISNNVVDKGISLSIIDNIMEGKCDIDSKEHRNATNQLSMTAPHNSTDSGEMIN